MRQKLRSVFLSIIASFFTSGAFGQTESKARLTKPEDIQKTVQSKETLYEDRTGFVTFLGINGGYSILSESETETRKSKTGYLIGGEFLASWYPSSFVFDAGLGWQYSKLFGEDRENATDKDFTGVSIETQAPFAAIGVLYRITDKFQLGLKSNLLFASDVGFDSFKTNSSPAFFAGPQVAFGVPEKLGDLRFFASSLFSLGLSSKLNVQITAGLLFGVPWIKPDTIYKERNIVGVTQKIQKTETTTVVPKIVFKQVSRFSFNQNEIVFKPRKAVLGVENQKFLIDLSIVLQESKQFWQELTLEAYVPASEAVGVEALKISQARSAALRNALISAGLSADPLKSRASQLNQKQSTALESNGDKSFFELVFSGVSNEAALNDMLTKFKTKFKRPETCKNETDCK